MRRNDNLGIRMHELYNEKLFFMPDLPIVEKYD
jgi:hypothetical protein